VQLEQRGTPAFTICTTPFLSLARAQAKTLGASAEFAIAEIAHPLGGTSEAEVKLRADAAWPQLEEWLNARYPTA
jgi:putative alpha-1,2-mannosidase